jgi:uncharacterized protein YdaU (DUF1376 family)
MTELPWFPLYARDWLSGEGTSRMLPEQEGAFVRLLCVAWADGSAEPSLPDDDRALAQMSRLGPRWKRLGGLVRDQFSVSDGRLFNAKLSLLWRQQQQIHDAMVLRAAAGGKAAAEKRKHRLGTTEALPKSNGSTSQEVLKPAYTDADAEATNYTTTTTAREALLAAVPNRTAWEAEFRAITGGMAGHLHATTAQLDAAITDYVANNNFSQRPPSLGLFKGYVKQATTNRDRPNREAEIDRVKRELREEDAAAARKATL